MNVVRQAGKVRLLVLGGALMVLVSLMAWGQAAGQSAHAEDTGVRLAFNANGLGVTCDAPSEPTECTVPLDGVFTLSVEAVEPPPGGYTGIQTFINYGIYDPEASEDRQGPGTCGDGIDNFDHDDPDLQDRNSPPIGDCVKEVRLTYHATSPGEEIVWPDLASADIALSLQQGAGLVMHGGLSGLIPPLPDSSYVGSVVELVMSCPSTESTYEVELLPLGDPVADVNGTAYAIGIDDEVASKPDTLTINCEEVIVEEPTPVVTGAEATATPGAQALPPTGTGIFGDLGGEDGVNGASGVNGDGGGLNAGLWAAIGVLLAAAALALAFFGRRYARRRQAG